MISVSLRGPPGDITEQGQETSVQGKQGLPLLEIWVDMAVCANYWTFGKNVMREWVTLYFLLKINMSLASSQE